MKDFNKFKQAVDQQLALMSGYTLLTTAVTKDALWETYLLSFPTDSNPIYKERTEHDCQCCKQFIRAAGSIVAIVNNELVSIWDISLDGPYGIVAKAMSKLVKTHPINNKFIHYENTLGTDKSHQETDTGILTWNHFYYKLASSFVMNKDQIPTHLGKYRTNVETFTRALKEITTETIDTVLELIDQNSIYRGVEYKKNVQELSKQQTKYNNAINKEIFVWSTKVTPAVASIRNSSIGTLLIDLSTGMDLNAAVTRYENVVAPENYKRPTSLITKAMITKAQEKVKELGLEESLNRRFAIMSDLTVPNTIFVNRDAKKAMGVFDELSNEVPIKAPKLDKVEEVNIEDFIKNILPKASAIELMVENNHKGNFVSLIAPQDIQAPNILKWDNNFSWSYTGEVADSMKERVKAAGGDITGVLRYSLQWNEDEKSDRNIDFDAHCIEPNSHLIYYPSAGQRHSSSGVLDVDNTNPGSRIAVENITWSNRNKMKSGKYQFIVHNYSSQKSIKGFTTEIEFAGKTYTFVYDKPLKGHEKILVAEIEILADDSFKILKSLPSTTASQEMWGIHTYTYQNVSMIMHSPNYWDKQTNGNKHWFFMLTNCINPNKARGFYNEFLRDELTEHRKVFEVLSSKLKTPESANQLSGVGFSSTQRNSVLCKISGAFSRIIKINF